MLAILLALLPVVFWMLVVFVVSHDAIYGGMFADGGIDLRSAVVVEQPLDGLVFTVCSLGRAAHWPFWCLHRL